MLKPMCERHSSNNCGCNNRESILLRKLQAIDFAIYDTVLYLDAYPNCRRALSHYHSLLEMQKRLKAEYESHYGPITAFGNESRTDWTWTATPWPWEMS